MISGFGIIHEYNPDEIIKSVTNHDVAAETASHLDAVARRQHKDAAGFAGVAAGAAGASKMLKGRKAGYAAGGAALTGILAGGSMMAAHKNRKSAATYRAKADSMSPSYGNQRYTL